MGFWDFPTPLDPNPAHHESCGVVSGCVTSCLGREGSGYPQNGQVIVFRSIPDTFAKGTLHETPSATLLKNPESGEAEFFAIGTRRRTAPKWVLTTSDA